MPRHLALTALVTLTPAALLVAGGMTGGVWLWAALGWLVLVVPGLDALAPSPGVQATGAETTALLARRLSELLATGHFLLLLIAVWAVSGANGLSVLDRVVAFFAFGLFFGQVSNANAHELIHCPERRLERLGRWVFISLLFGHHASAHRLVHHRHVATPLDPNSAPAGMSAYAFLPRAWAGSFRAGLSAENRMRGAREAGPREGQTRSGPPRRRAGGLHPYLAYLVGGAAFIVAAAALFGWPGVAAYLVLSLHAQAQLLLSDYVQHYGLRRTEVAPGRYEPVAARHAWNAAPWFSAALMLHAARHSDHHMHPAKPFPALELPPAAEAPRLPHALPVMAAIALLPRLWFRLMDRRLERLVAAREASLAAGQERPSVAR